jgi:hypothetical protein
MANGSGGRGPWWDDPLYTVPVMLVVLFLIFVGPTACEALGIKP